jgi:2-C-methyl-D-erythritol 2,4-cyclodiphosphate synthase
MKIGFGYDVHRLTEKRKLIIGGVNIPYEKGLLGHSDADVLAHAIGDALLGATALGDLGAHFPPSEAKYKDISSMILLQNIHAMVLKKNFKLVNIDATIVAEKPKLIHYIQEMRRNIADVLRLRLDQVSVKATTTEGLGFTGTGEGIAVYAVCLIDEVLQK